MHYYRLRYRIYVNEIKQMIAAISSISTILAVFFINVLIPVFLMAALMAVGIIASNSTETSERMIYQWVYLLVVYLLVKVQAKAMLANAYGYYVNMLPVSKAKRVGTDMLLLLNGGNLVLLAPLAFCLFIPNLQQFISSAYFVVFALSVLLLSLLALYRQRIPLGTLLLVPVIAVSKADHALWPNLLWLLVMVFELLWLDKLKLRLKPLAINHYWQVIALFVRHRPVNFLLRGLIAAAFIGSYSYVVAKRPDFAGVSLQLAVCLPIALVLGSYQFEIERFRSQYHYYCQSLPLMPAFLRRIEAWPLLLLGTLSLGLAWFCGFGFGVLILLLIQVALGACGVVWFNRHYYLPPLAVTALSYAIWLGL